MEKGLNIKLQNGKTLQLPKGVKTVPQTEKRGNVLTYPGDWARMNEKQLQDLRNFVADQKKCVGTIIATAAGAQVSVNLTIPQRGKMLLGFAFIKTIPQGAVSLYLNNEKFVDNMNGEFFNRATLVEEFFYYPRPLTGLDQLQIDITDTAAQSCPFAAYYI